MPRWNGFGRSLVFAALAAAGLPVVVTFVGPLLGAATSARLYLIAAAGLYAVGLGAERGRQRAAWLAVGIGGSALALLPLGLAGTALGAAGLVAFCRSGLHQRQRPLRALVIEALLGALGLLVAEYLAGGGLLGLCLALWGYFLVQSAYFLIGGRSVRHDAAPADPFEQARSRLLRWLEDEVGASR